MNKRFLMVLGLALSAALIAGPAMATEPIDANAPKDTGDNASTNVNPDRYLYLWRNFWQLGAPGLLGIVEEKPRNYPSSSSIGLSGGEHEDVRRINIWASGTYSNYEDTLSSTDMDGETWNATAGVDYLFLDWLIAGLSLGFEDSDTDTNFNRGNVDTDGVTVSPYVLFLLNQYISVDGAVGYSDIDIDQDRTLPGTATVVTSSLTPSASSARPGSTPASGAATGTSAVASATSTPPRTMTPSWRATAPSTPSSIPSSGRRS